LLILAGLVVVAGAVALLYLYLRRQSNPQSLWRRAIVIGIGIGIVRATLASYGWYTLERTSGPLQIPAYVLVMLALPEAAITAGRRTSPHSPEFLVWLSLLLVVSTTALVALVAFLANRRRRS
jgi:multisubunit Na+/H+ antiporter MnhB subunit